MNKKTEFFLTVCAYALVGGVVSLVGAINRKKEEKREKELMKQTNEFAEKCVKEMQDEKLNSFTTEG